MKAVILAGGSGDRLWPLSRRNFPKQFMQQNNGNSLFQETVIRNIPFCDEVIVVTNVAYREIVEGQLQGIQGVPYRLVLEREAKGTAPVTAVISSLMPEEEELLFLPADLYLQGEGYSDAIYRAKELGAEGRIVLFGTRAESPADSYGYIRYRGTDVTRYIEKPQEIFAKEIFADDDIFWNSGMLFCKNAVLRQELETYAPTLWEWAGQAAKEGAADDRKVILLTGRQMDALERTHIEKTLLEESQCLSVVRLRCRWKDISNFDSYEHSPFVKEEHDTIKTACVNTSVINAAERQLVVANGLEDILIVNTEDAVYVTNKNMEQDIKGIISESEKEGKYEDFFRYNPKTYRSWGTREIIAQAKGYRVRKLELYPGATLSSHRHAFRNENYAIIKGTLSLEIDGKTYRITDGESMNVLPGQVHRLYNETDETVIGIEVDTGSEIDERDMIHPEDKKEEELPHLYRLSPAYKDYLWGGTKLKTLFGKDSPYETTAESWELSAHKDGQSVIADGPFSGMAFGDFVRKYGSRVCGWKSRTFDRFPILIKFIDALEPLSVQIHPYDDYAFMHEKEFGKNEMWYVMDAAPSAYLYCGFSRDVTKEEIARRLEDHTITEILNKVEVKKGDVIFIPAGTIHAIGAGILICEVQQNSNSTYRVYDYDRMDREGNRRPLHIKKAMDVITTNAYEADANGLEEPEEIESGTMRQLCLCKYFTCRQYRISGNHSFYLDDASFASFVFLDGSARVDCEDESIEVGAGDSLFVSAGRKVVKVDGDCEFILTNL